MIALNLLLDILIANFTIFHSYFFLINIFKIRYRYVLLLVLIAIFIDTFITHTILLNIIVLLIIYFIEKKYFYKHENLLKNVLLNVVNFFIYNLCLYLFFHYQNINILVFFKNIYIDFIIYVIYCLISYKLYLKS